MNEEVSDHTESDDEPSLHQDRLFKCSKCGAAFTKEGFLNRHLKIIHNKVIRSKYDDLRCHICNKGFKKAKYVL